MLAKEQPKSMRILLTKKNQTKYQPNKKPQKVSSFLGSHLGRKKKSKTELLQQR